MQCASRKIFINRLHPPYHICDLLPGSAALPVMHNPTSGNVDLLMWVWSGISLAGLWSYGPSILCPPLLSQLIRSCQHCRRHNEEQHYRDVHRCNYFQPAGNYHRLAASGNSIPHQAAKKTKNTEGIKKCSEWRWFKQFDCITLTQTQTGKKAILVPTEIFKKTNFQIVFTLYNV